MAEKGIFISVLPKLELAALAAAATQMRNVFTKLGVDIKSTMDAQMVAAAKAADEVAVAETRATASYNRMAKSAGDAQVAEARVNELRALNVEETSSRMIRAENAVADNRRRAQAAYVAHARDEEAVTATRAKNADALAASSAGAAGIAGKAWNSAGLIATVAMVGIGVESGKTAAQVEQNMNRMVVMHQESANSISQMTQQVYELANQVPFSVQKLSEGLSLIEQHGYRGQDAMNALKVSAQAATAVGADLSSTVGGLTTQLDDMGYQGKKGPELLNDMNTMASQLVVSLKDLKNLNPAELFTSLHSVEPSAKAYMTGLAGNQASAQVMAAMDALSQTGMSQEQSAPNLARLISTLGAIRPKSTTYSALGQLGIQQEDIAQQMQNQGFLPVIQTIQEAINSRTNKDTGLVDMGWKYNNDQVNELIEKDKQGLSAGGQDFLKNHPDIESGLARPFSLKKDLAKTGLSGEEGQDIITLAQWESMVHGPTDFIKKGGTADITQGQAYQLLYGTGDVARTGLILGQDPKGNIDKSKDIVKQGTPENFQAAFDQAMQSTTNQWKQLGASAGSLAGRIGNDLLPLLKTVIDGFTGVVNFLSRHKTTGDLLIRSMEVVAALWTGSKLINAIDGIRQSFAKLGGSAATAGATLETSSATAGAEMKAGAARLSEEETASGAALNTGAATASTEMGAGAAKLSAEETTAGATLEAGATSAAATLRAGAAAAAAGLATAAASLAAMFAAGPIDRDIENNGPKPVSDAMKQGNSLVPSSQWYEPWKWPLWGSFGNQVTDAVHGNLHGLQIPGGTTIGGSFGPPDTPAPPGPPTTPPPPPDDSGLPSDSPDHTGDTGSGIVPDDGGSGGSKATATGPNIAALAPGHPIDTNPADKPPGYETYDQWISGQEAVANALDRVDDTATAMSAAQAKMTELIKKGHGTQEEWNSTQEALNKATRDNAKARQAAAVAETKAHEEAAKTPKRKSGDSSLGDEDPFQKAMDSSSSPWGKLAAFGTTLLAEMAFGNPYGKIQAAKQGSDPSNPMYVSDVNGLLGGQGQGAGKFGIPQMPGASTTYSPEEMQKLGIPPLFQNPSGGGNPEVPAWLQDFVTQFGGPGLTASSTPHGALHGTPGSPGWAVDVTGPQDQQDAFARVLEANPELSAMMIHQSASGEPFGIAGGQNVPKGTYFTTPGGTYADEAGMVHWAPSFRPGGGDGSDGGDMGNPMSSLWNSVAQAESGGNWSNRDTGHNGHYGGLQFSPQTWLGFGGGQFAQNPADATPDQQAAIANNTAFNGYGNNPPQGLSAWQTILQGMVPGVTANSNPADVSDIATGGGGGMGPGNIPNAPVFKRSPPTPQPAVPGRGVGAGVRPGVGNNGLVTPDQRALNSQVDNRQPGQGAPGAGGGGGSGGGGGFQIPGAITGAVQAAAPMLDAIAPGAGQAVQKGTQLANRAAQYVGQLAGIGIDGIIETFGLNDSAIGDPSKSIFGKLAMGLAGAHPAKDNTAGKTAPPLKPDDNKNKDDPNKPGQPPGPMINIENQHINNNGNNGQVERDMNRVLIGQGIR
jgi:TP901 family phage tail tape measure protein